MKKKILNRSEIQPHIKEGMNQITSIVAATLGPGGLPILIQRTGQQLNGEPLGPMATKDGVSVANECSSPFPEVDVVIQAVKDVCRKTNKEAGDGTTTAIVLGKAVMDSALKQIEDLKMNPQEVKNSIEKASLRIDEYLKSLAIPCKEIEMIEHVARISANGDSEISSVIRGAFEAVGAEGVITVDEGGSRDHSLEVVNGFQFKRGAEAQDNFFNNESGTKFESENVHVIIYDGKMQETRALLNCLEVLYKQYQGKMPALLFIANEFSQDVVHALKIFRAEQGLSVCVVRGPHTTTVRSAMYDDIAVFLGGNKLGNGNRNLMNIEMDDIGIAKKVSIDKYTTTFFDGQGDEEYVIKRVDALKAQRSLAESPYDGAILSDRIAALSEGIAKIGVGGSTDFEIKEKYHRIEDAVNAARAAVEEGIIPGGGVTLLRLANVLSEAVSDPGKPPTVGEVVLAEALKAPFRQILSNLGMSDSKILEIEEKVLKAEKDTTFDGVSLEVVKAFEAGIVDPVKVTRSALKNAISICSLLSTCGGSIIYEPTKS